MIGLAVAAAGAVSIAAALAWIYPPAGLLFIGCLLFTVGIVMPDHE